MKFISFTITCCILGLMSCGEANNLTSFSKRKYLKKGPRQKVKKEILHEEKLYTGLKPEAFDISQYKSNSDLLASSNDFSELVALETPLKLNLVDSNETVNVANLEKKWRQNDKEEVEVQLGLVIGKKVKKKQVKVKNEKRGNAWLSVLWVAIMLLFIVLGAVIFSFGLNGILAIKGQAFILFLFAIETVGGALMIIAGIVGLISLLFSNGKIERK